MRNGLYEEAVRRFESLPFPGGADEHWRFANLKFWGKEIRGLVSLPEKGDCRFEEAKDEVSARFYDSLLKGGKFDALAAMAFCSRSLTRVPAGGRLKIDADFAGLANVFIVEDGAELEIFRSHDFEDGAFWIEANCFALGRGAKLSVNTHFTSGAASPRYSRNDFYLSEGARVTDVFVENGRSNTRAERNFHLEGGSARADVFALLDCRGGITHDFRSSQIHSSGGAHSNLKVKNILSDVSRSAFTGLIRVEGGAQKTEAYQSCRSLLLSPSAKSGASPVLEIMANDVLCSHGCAVARPDKDQLFYMKSRGLPGRTADRLLVSGFANEVLDMFADPIFAERVRAAIQK